jgi:hypothetical protein
MKKTNYLLAILFLLIGIKSKSQSNVADFENLTLSPESYWDGSDLSGSALATKYFTEFNSGDVMLSNTWIPNWGGYWAGDWLYSSSEDDTTSGSMNSHSCIVGMGANNSANYVIGGNKSFMAIDTSSNDSLMGIYITNTTYAHNSMRDGDYYGKIFGDSLNASGDNDSTNGEDFFKLMIYSIENGTEQDSIMFMLADYTFEDNTNDYIVDEWKFVDLSSFGVVDSLMFSLTSSDVGLYGMNTPAYFALDNVKIGDTTFGFENLELDNDSFFNGSDLSGTPDNPNFFANFSSGNVYFTNVWNNGIYPNWASGWAYSNMTDSVTAGYTNQYSAITAIGIMESENYAIGRNNSYITYDTTTNFSANVTNSTYAYLSMKDGDSYGKIFGSNLDANGDDDGTNGEDYFTLSIHGYNDGDLVDSTDFYLADYRFEDDNQDYLVNTWQYVTLEQEVDSVTFVLNSSDIGLYGMNTPAYFAIDNIGDYPLSLIEHSTMKLDLYPNPSSDFINIGYQKNLSSYLVSVYDIFGKKVISNLKGATRIDISKLNKGQYMLQIESEIETINERFLKL